MNKKLLFAFLLSAASIVGTTHSLLASGHKEGEKSGKHEKKHDKKAEHKGKH